MLTKIGIIGILSFLLAKVAAIFSTKMGILAFFVGAVLSVIMQGTLLFAQAQEPVIVQQSANWTSVIMAAIAAVPSTIAAIVGGMALLQTRRNAQVAATTEAVLKQNVAQTEVVIGKATEIHTLTNSNLSKVQNQLDIANEKIDGFNRAQTEAVRKIANMELLITSLTTSLAPKPGEQSPSQTNSDKLDSIADQVAAGAEHAQKIALDLAKSHARADAVSSPNPGAAADAAARQTKEEKEVLKEESER